MAFTCILRKRVYLNTLNFLLLSCGIAILHTLNYNDGIFRLDRGCYMGRIRVLLISKKMLFIILVVINVIFFLAWFNLKDVETTFSGTVYRPIVVIDPGHGGVDSGAVFENIMEKDITLDISLHIRDLLQKKDIPFVLTRESDIDLGGELTKGRHKRDLLARRQIINQGKIAVSIHVNTIDDHREEGAVVFYAEGSKEGEKLATSILNELGKIQKLNYHQPIPRSNLFLLRTSTPPMVLVELGFISNKEDRVKLLNSDFRKKCAQAIVQGIQVYLETII